MATDKLLKLAKYVKDTHLRKQANTPKWQDLNLLKVAEYIQRSAGEEEFDSEADYYKSKAAGFKEVAELAAAISDQYTKYSQGDDYEKFESGGGAHRDWIIEDMERELHEKLQAIPE